MFFLVSGRTKLKPFDHKGFSPQVDQKPCGQTVLNFVLPEKNKRNLENPYFQVVCPSFSQSFPVLIRISQKLPQSVPCRFSLCSPSKAIGRQVRHVFKTFWACLLIAVGETTRKTKKNYGKPTKNKETRRTNKDALGVSYFCQYFFYVFRVKKGPQKRW